MKIGFLGLGKMGSGIAANLVRAGHEVTVWNRSAQKAQQLVAQGAVLANTPKAAASGRALVMSMLGDDAALDQVLHGVTAS
jgi:3-hydroxyisobutyrate dehydrogenase-like beta-hydroxyacid dehydrogenase